MRLKFDLNAIAQAVIAVFGVAAIWLSQSSSPESQKWACVFGLIAQPFWFYAALKSRQWGVFILTIACTAA